MVTNNTAVILFATSSISILAYKQYLTCTLKDATRFVFSFIPMNVQHWLRKSGIIKNIANGGTLSLAAGLCMFQPSLAYRFSSLSSIITSHKYGTTDKHYIEMFRLGRPMDLQQKNNCLVFVHGGAWGSGKAWHYRLVAEGLGRLLGSSVVILVGYPVYPYAIISEQSECVKAALHYINTDANIQSVLRGAGAEEIVLAGHSSGANICALALLSEHQSPEESEMSALPPVAAFIGLAGVYDIAKHYLFEADRGVHHISPMAAAAVREDVFHLSSPTLVAQEIARVTSAAVGVSRPSIPCLRGTHVVLIHGTRDSTVPHTSSEEFAESLKGLGVDVHTEFIECDHGEPVLDVMFVEPTTATSAIVRAWRRFKEKRTRDMTSEGTVGEV